MKTKSRTFKRHNINALLPEMLRRVSAGQFISLAEIATAYGVDKATACRWKERALQCGSIDEPTWRVFLLRARIQREARG